MAVEDLLEDWSNASPLPPFKRISVEDFPPAFKEAIDDARDRISRIADRTDEPTFENVIDEFELATEALDRVCSVFDILADTESDDRLRSIELETVPQLARFDVEVRMNRRLFARLDQLWRRRNRIGLNEEMMTVLRRHHRSFETSGARLEGPDRQRMAEVKERLAVLCTQFSQNVLADEAAWHMQIAERDLEDLPEFLRTAAAQAASQRGLEGHVITLDRSLIEPFLMHSGNRSLRERAHRAWSRRGANGGTTDNGDIIKEIIRLRHDVAALLDSSSYAAHTLEDEMAKNPEAVRKLLTTVWAPARKAAESDQAGFEAELRRDGQVGGVEPWDWRYYAERRRKEECDLDEAIIKRHFRLDRIADAAFDVALRLFGLEFSETDVAAHNPDCRVWSVSRRGKPVGIFVADYFARPSKRSGAWCSTLSVQGKLGRTVRPVAVNVCNFIRPADGEPCLLSYDDARTLFHEFGHALHVLLSDVTYPSVACTSVVRDLVELPSQLFEKWLETDEVLDRYAIDPETGRSLPPDIRASITAARRLDQPFATVEYLASAFVDLEFHEGTPPENPFERQERLLKELGMPRAIAMRHAAPHFQHIFAGDGYASKYYSYLWADVLVADAFEAFLENGGAYCGKTASKFEREVLATGGSRDPAETYVRFRGRLPEPDALLRSRGFETNA